MQRRLCYIGAGLFFFILSFAAGAQDAAWVGTFATDEPSDAGIQQAIVAATANMNFLTRSVARGRLKKTNELYRRISIARQGDTISVSFDGRKPIQMPADGSAIRWTREDGEVFDVAARVEPERLVQTFKAEDGQRVNAFIAEDARKLRLEVEVTSPRLPKPLTYSLRYLRTAE